MSINKKHTFVIMGYGESEYLEEAYQALKAQTVKSNIIMTSSTPNDFQKDFAKIHNIPYIVNPDRQGFAGDLNFAYASAETDYVTMVHQDDILMREYTEKCLYEANKYIDYLIIFTDYREYKNGIFQKNSVNVKIKKLILNTFFPFKNNLSFKPLKKYLLSFGNPIVPASIMFNKNKIDDFKFKTNFEVSPEWEGLIRLSKRTGRFIYIREPLYIYRLHDEQITATGIKDRKLEDKMVFDLLWPKPISYALSKFYAYCYNIVPKQK